MNHKLIEILEMGTSITSIVETIQNYVWQDLSESDPLFDQLCDLAYDLDFFQPNPDFRLEDSSFLNEKQAVEVISIFISQYLTNSQRVPILSYLKKLLKSCRNHKQLTDKIEQEQGK